MSEPDWEQQQRDIEADMWDNWSYEVDNLADEMAGMKDAE